MAELDVLVLSEPQYQAIANARGTKIQYYVSEAIRRDIEVLPISEFLERSYGYVDVKAYLSNHSVQITRPLLFNVTKRVFDCILSGLLLIILFPLMLTISIVVLIADGRPVLFRQKRLGKGSKVFSILKFRTLEPNENQEPTRLGYFLRRSHLDELPQLVNIFLGDMAFIGPRPEWVLLTSPELAPEGYWLRQAVRPGLSGWAQVNYKPSRTVHMRRRKLGYDLYYINHRSFLLDILIWFRTLQRLPMLPYQSIRNIIRGDMRRS